METQFDSFEMKKEQRRKITVCYFIKTFLYSISEKIIFYRKSFLGVGRDVSSQEK
jgi:hypothetical protein